MKRLELGRRSNGTFGGRISAPGNDVDVPGARMLFTTDTQIMQVLFEGSLPMAVTRRTVFFNGGPLFPSYTDYYFRGTGTFFFPRVLDFCPSVSVLAYETKDSTPAYIDLSLPNYLRFASFTDRVEFVYDYAITANNSVDALSLYVMVLNLSYNS